MFDHDVGESFIMALQMLRYTQTPFIGTRVGEIRHTITDKPISCQLLFVQHEQLPGQGWL